MATWEDLNDESSDREEDETKKLWFPSWHPIKVQNMRRKVITEFLQKAYEELLNYSHTLSS